MTSLTPNEHAYIERKLIRLLTQLRSERRRLQRMLDSTTNRTGLSRSEYEKLIWKVSDLNQPIELIEGMVDHVRHFGPVAITRVFEELQGHGIKVWLPIK